MIIVSQNKRKIVNFDNLLNIDYYKIDENFEIDANTENDSVCLGRYKTEERAKEVLQEIINCFSFTELTGEPERLKLIFEITKLGRYQMPKE